MIESKRLSLNRSVLVVGLVIAAGAAWLAVSIRTAGGETATLPEAPSRDAAAAQGLKVAPEKGALAPNFRLKTLQGEEVRLGDLRGRPVVINFWATWCAPCRIEMPAIQSRFERYRQDDLVVLAVNFDEPAGPVEAFREELGLTFTILLDPGAEVQQLYRNRSYPTTFFVDRDGVIRVQHIGLMTEGQLDENLAQIGLEG